MADDEDYAITKLIKNEIRKRKRKKNSNSMFHNYSIFTLKILYSTKYYFCEFLI